MLRLTNTPRVYELTIEDAGWLEDPKVKVDLVAYLEFTGPQDKQRLSIWYAHHIHYRRATAQSDWVKDFVKRWPLDRLVACLIEYKAQEAIWNMLFKSRAVESMDKRQPTENDAARVTAGVVPSGR